MSHPRMSQELALASRILEAARAAAGHTAEVEALVTRRALGLTRFANRVIHQNVAEVTTSVRLRLHVAGRTASAVTTVLGGTGVADLVERTLAAARIAPADPGWPGLTPPTPGGSPDTSGQTAPDDPAVTGSTPQEHESTPQERVEAVRAFIDATAGLTAAGQCSTTASWSAFANSTGRTATGTTHSATLDGVARTGGSDGLGRRSARRLADLDGHLLGARAAAKARSGRDPIDIPPGRYEVVLEPTAVSDLLNSFAMHGFNGKLVAERCSFAEIGERQFDQSVTFIDDPGHPDTPGQSFDPEGTARRRLALVHDGVTVAVAHDRRSAASLGVESNGRAHLDSLSSGPTPVNLAMLAGQGPAGTEVPDGSPCSDGSVAALVAGVRRGLLVTDNWYTRVLDPRTLVMTGLTRNGVWLIEDGEVTRPVSNLRFTQSYPDALAPGAVVAVGTTAIGLAESEDGVIFSAPALHLASWNFTGGAAG